MAEAINLWEKIGNGCLDKALKLLEKDTTPTATTVGMVRELVETAISIDLLNLCWDGRSQYDAPVFRG